MSVLTRVRTAEERVLRTQLPEQSARASTVLLAASGHATPWRASHLGRVG